MDNFAVDFFIPLIFFLIGVTIFLRKHPVRHYGRLIVGSGGVPIVLALFVVPWGGFMTEFLMSVGVLIVVFGAWLHFMLLLFGDSRR